MITLFGNLDSGNVYKVQLILAHLGIAYRRVDVAQTRGEPATAVYRQVNPIGKVPAVLLENDRVLSESGAILYRFAAGTPFWPECLDDQCDILRWMVFEKYSHEPAIAVNRYLLNYAGDPAAHSEAIARNHPKGLAALSVMESWLCGQDWLAAGRYSIADMALYAYSHVANEAGYDLAEFPAVGSWIARVRRQPDFMPMMTDGASETLAFADYFTDQ